MNIPNILSGIRILLVPVLVVSFFMTPEGVPMIVPAIILIISGVTDWLDGYIARKIGAITELGKILDPLADKLTQITILGCFAVRYTEMLVLFIIYTAKEIVTLSGALWVIKKKETVTIARWYGKLATFIFYAAMLFTLIAPQYFEQAKFAVIGVIVFTAFFAFIRYTIEFLKIKRG
ncbi:MAG: CDP-alcohol phosphatidyltransferase family protein [Oscillospiraceae bacterium]|nr:CDP-alcohol phosphatidyltransferase family protein [Oscillospiraceae bacterium]